jgi:adenylyl-sulfate kinase
MNSNITWEKHKVSPEERQKIKGHKPACIWFTGLSGSGKSTIANQLDAELTGMGMNCFLLDGDNVRHGLNKDLGFSDLDREENIRRLAEVAKLFTDAGLIVIASFISPFRKDREFAREIIGTDKFIEVYVKVPIEVCEGRDPKGLYKKARKGEVKEFTGIDSPYEEPGSAEIVIENMNGSRVEEHVERIIGIVKRILGHKVSQR